MLKLYTQGTFQCGKRVVICRGQGTYFLSPYFNLRTKQRAFLSDEQQPEVRWLHSWAVVLPIFLAICLSKSRDTFKYGDCGIV